MSVSLLISKGTVKVVSIVLFIQYMPFMPLEHQKFQKLIHLCVIDWKEQSVFIKAHQKMWWPSQNKMNQLNCHIMMTLGTRYAQASGSKLQRVTNKMFYFPLNQCTWWKSDSTSICQLYRKDANFRLGASLPAQHSFRVVKFQKCSKNQSHICQPGK